MLRMLAERRVAPLVAQEPSKHFKFAPVPTCCLYMLRFGNLRVRGRDDPWFLSMVVPSARLCRFLAPTKCVAWCAHAPPHDISGSACGVTTFVLATLLVTTLPMPVDALLPRDAGRVAPSVKSSKVCGEVIYGAIEMNSKVGANGVTHPLPHCHRTRPFSGDGQGGVLEDTGSRKSGVSRSISVLECGGAGYGKER